MYTYTKENSILFLNHFPPFSAFSFTVSIHFKTHLYFKATIVVIYGSSTTFNLPQVFLRIPQINHYSLGYNILSKFHLVYIFKWIFQKLLQLLYRLWNVKRSTSQTRRYIRINIILCEVYFKVSLCCSWCVGYYTFLEPPDRYSFFVSTPTYIKALFKRIKRLFWIQIKHWEFRYPDAFQVTISSIHVWIRFWHNRLAGFN